MGNALYFGDELKYLLKNLKQLSDEQRNILENKIEQGIKRHAQKKIPKDTLLYLNRRFMRLFHTTLISKVSMRK